MDVDDLASVNDRHGVETGDILLAAIATRLTRAAPLLADLGRISGDEFVLVVRLPAAPGHEDARRARADLGARLRASLFEPEPGLPDGAWRTVSTVVSMSEPGFADPDALLREAFAHLRARKALIGGASGN
jgi:GGDEF domain-containing protein